MIENTLQVSDYRILTVALYIFTAADTAINHSLVRKDENCEDTCQLPAYPDHNGIVLYITNNQSTVPSRRGDYPKFSHPQWHYSQNNPIV